MRQKWEAFEGPLPGKTRTGEYDELMKEIAASGVEKAVLDEGTDVKASYLTQVAKRLELPLAGVQREGRVYVVRTAK